MSTTSLHTKRQAFWEGLNLWATGQGTVILFVLKAVCSAFLGLWLAYRLEMPQPGTVLATVFIVLQRNTGDILAKSFYRIIGSLAGLTVMITLIAAFNQERVLFMLLLSCWIGICVAGAARFRDFRSYACILAGYTAVMIGIPAAQHPDDAFMQAIWRVVEIVVGILCTGLVSGTFFPQTSSASLRQTQRRTFQAFCDFASKALSGEYTRHQQEQRSGDFFRQAAALDNLLTASAFENPSVRLRRGRLARMNHGFMVMNSRLHALLQLLNRRKAADANDAAAMSMAQILNDCLQELIGPLQLIAREPLLDQDAAAMARDLMQHRRNLKTKIRHTRSMLAASGAALSQRLDFDTAAELLYRALTDLHDYVLTQHSLIPIRHEREKFRERFRPHANRMAAFVSGIRCTILLLILTAFWFASGWDSGDFFVLTAGLVAGLVSVAIHPGKLGIQIFWGALASGITGFLLQFYILPWVDGFELLVIALLPIFILGCYLLSDPKTMGYGVGWCVWFCILSTPGNLTHYLPYQFLNAWLAVMLAMIAVTITVSLVLPPTHPWLWRRLEKDLRMHVIKAVKSPLNGLQTRFESGIRDLLSQAFTLTQRDPAAQAYLTRWAFTASEVGQAVIQLRQERNDIARFPHNFDQAHWQQQMAELDQTLVAVFSNPSDQLCQQVLAAADRCINLVDGILGAEPAHFSDSPLRRLLSHLHYIRTALLDPTSSLRETPPSNLTRPRILHAT